ncbi:MAG TPA: hypothetical protein ENH55_22810 [Aurantimonas coralicida]|uniref:Uncharacterized protein n=1 Tax=Aurantimonas coralicida TaxID=182270 RepID=A0A9C9NBW8_9HYPH|nr:hypothetical protein [Aurantimonas coralicida]HET99002.1 hypothetical protein [Aurantimonas coralicida]
MDGISLITRRAKPAGSRYRTGFAGVMQAHFLTKHSKNHPLRFDPRRCVSRRFGQDLPLRGMNNLVYYS